MLKWLHLEVSCNVIKEQTDIEQKWKSTLSEASKILMALSIDHYENLLKTIKAQVNSISNYWHKPEILSMTTLKFPTKLSLVRINESEKPVYVLELRQKRQRKMQRLKRSPSRPCAFSSYNKFLGNPQTRHPPGRTGRRKLLYRSRHVIHLSSKYLSDVEISVFPKGFTFVPSFSTPKRSTFMDDFNRFARHLRIKHIFRESTKNYVKNPLYVSSDCNPIQTDNHELESYIRKTRIELEEHLFDRQRSNLTPAQRLALTSLRRRTDIVRKRTDIVSKRAVKGSSTLVEEGKEYINEAMQHLLQPDVYRIHHEDPSLKTYRLVGNLLFDASCDHVLTKD